MKFLLTILAFNLMIIIHEMGHFLVAKFFNVYVKEFSLFVGPKIFSKKIGETIYSLRTIPIAAYVKMEGEEELSESDRSYNKKAVWQRALIILAGPLANIVSAIVAIAIVFSMTGVDTLKVSRVEKGSPAELAGVKVGDRFVEYDGKSTYTTIDYLTYTNIRPGAEALVKVDRGGQIVPLTLKPLTEFKDFIIGCTFKDATTAKIEGLADDMPAKKAGLLVGDVITQIDDVKILAYDELKSAINLKKGETVKIVVNRNGAEIPAINVKPQEREFKQGVYVGLAFSMEEQKGFDIMKSAVLFGYSNTKNVPYTLKWLFTGDVKVNQLMGPVGIVASINSAVSESVDYKELFINLMGTFALISVAIGATNLVPFPALDGSKLVLLLLEGIRRKPIPVEKEAAISLAGLAVLMVFAIFVTYGDVNRLLTGFFKP